ncbi:MAG: DNA ligase D [Candidatus Longimicrobiales bacterium M2_2A_002]
MPEPRPLEAYHEKRSLDRTPEPGGGTLSSAGSLFAVQKHAATRTHYDLRLELDGVLKSWAVPRTPSYDQSVKRVAIHVEDHPLEYASFEGVIPEGNYGAGPVIVWDRGVWVPLKDPHEGLEEGKLLFELRGHKLRGRWTLVKMKKTEKEWLLIKERDGLEGEGRELAEASILSGLTVEQLGEGYDPTVDIIDMLDGLDAPAGSVDASAVDVMLAETREEPFSDPAWVFELKYDGYRLVAGLEGGRARLISRNGNDLTASFPEVARALEALPFSDLVLDGEVVVHDERGIPSFQRLQKRARLSRSIDIDRAAMELPATLYLFDCLGFHDRDLRPLPLLDRKQVLRRILPPVGPLRYSDHIPEKGAEMFERVAAMNLEGVMAKKVDSPYRGGRSADWLKIRADLTDDFAVIGWTEPKGGRSGFGALHLGAYEDDTLVYTGRVGTGFSDAQLEGIRRELEAHEVDEPPIEVGDAAPTGDEHHWAAPTLVVEVRYREWTDEGLLRHPVFLRLRDDRAPSECVKRVPVASLDIHVDPPEEERRDVRLTNTGKVFWPDDGYTKGDLIGYYEAIAPWILPYLEDRPLVLTRFPDGIDGKSFYQKDTPDWAPDWLRTVTIWSEGSQRELSYIVCDNVETLLWIANAGTIPLHVWHSGARDLQKPDWCVLDLDPKDAPFERVIDVARALHELCDEIDLPHYAKTSGSSGLHVLIPLARQFTHEQARILGHLLARVIAAGHDEIATLHRVIDRREGKVYLDYLQNGHGKLIAAPFSVRPKPGAPVSMPLRWDEVQHGLEILDFTLQNAVDRMEDLGDDPLRPVLEVKPDLLGALERLQERLERRSSPPG